MELNSVLWVTAALCVGGQLLAWLWQVKTKNTDIVDITWALLVVLCGLVYVFMSSGNHFHRYVALLIPIAWYARLAWHLIDRYSIDHEDGRYQQLRAHWSEHTQLKFLGFFLFQALLAFIFSYPVYIITASKHAWDIWDLLGIIIAIVSFAGVTLADYQLRQFKRQPDTKGKVCNIGLWRYSRHPNYFFEWTHWFAYPLIGWHTEQAWLLAIYPILMLIFLLKLTGIPFNEQQNIRSKGDAYRQYQKRTNKFFLGPTKSISRSTSYNRGDQS